jgi:hypothetical protein
MTRKKKLLPKALNPLLRRSKKQKEKSLHHGAKTSHLISSEIKQQDFYGLSGRPRAHSSSARMRQPIEIAVKDSIIIPVYAFCRFG